MNRLKYVDKIRSHFSVRILGNVFKVINKATFRWYVFHVRFSITLKAQNLILLWIG
nr:MAG TPA: hypothetical protein [Caudoviricetes sp.]